MVPENIEITLTRCSKQKLSNPYFLIINKDIQYKTVYKAENLKLNKCKISLKLLKLDNILVQKIVCLIMEITYESYFSKIRPNFNPIFKTHNLFNCIELRNFWVEKIVTDSCLQINSLQFCNILNKQFSNNLLVNLIYKLLRQEICQYSQFDQFNKGGLNKKIIFSIFTNIYFNELDNWVEYKTHQLTQVLTCHYVIPYEQLLYKTNKKTKQIQRLNKTAKKYKIIQKKLISLEQKKIQIINIYKQQIQIKYFRYLNNWVIGMKGEQFLIETLKIEINYFLLIYLKQTLNSIKLTTINLSRNEIQFMGYQIHFLNNRKINNYKQYFDKMGYQKNFRIKFHIPTDFIFRKMEKEGYIKKFTTCYQPISKIHYIQLENIIILKHFTQIWRGLLNHYSECNNLSKLQSIHYNLYLSFIMTLKDRYCVNIKILFAKYGKTFIVFKNGMAINFPYKI